MERLLSIGLIAFTIAGCAARQLSVSPNPNWTRVSGERAGCASFAPKRREAVDLNIVLAPAFEEMLGSQLGDQIPKAPRCWYETPGGSIRLFAGDFCGAGTDVFFEQKESAWKVVYTNDIWASCHPTGK